MINYFLVFTRDELELEAIKKQPVPILKLFKTIVAEYETELSGFDYRLNWSHSFDLNQVVMINEPMIRRVFGKLFGNTLRYGEKKELQIYLSGYPEGDYAHFQVEDNGVGVPAQDLSFLFQKFFTVDKSRKNKSGGTGLGLASCKSIIEHHGGAFHSQYGGLGIRFTIPLI